MAIKKVRQSGVTLIEMIVVVGIFSVVAAVLFFRYSDFSSGISIRNLSQEIALMTRRAQTYATSVRSLEGTVVTSEAYPAYGISFSAASSSAPYGANSKQFVLFADTIEGSDIDRFYDNGGSCGNPTQGNECIENFTITTSDRIVEICTDYPSANTCTTNGTVNVVFRRPAPDAEICVVSGGACITQLASYIKVTLESAKGTRRTVTVWNTGQISGQ